jgi:hypothetical protein
MSIWHLPKLLPWVLESWTADLWPFTSSNDELLPNAASMYINHDWALSYLIIYSAFGYSSTFVCNTSSLSVEQPYRHGFRICFDAGYPRDLANTQLCESGVPTDLYRGSTPHDYHCDDYLRHGQSLRATEPKVGHRGG